MFYQFFVPELHTKKRIDIVLSYISEFSRSQIKKLIRENGVYCNGFIVKDSDKKVNFGDLIEITKTSYSGPSDNLVPSYKKLDIIFEDECLIVINKPTNTVVHPAPGNYEDTVVNSLIAHCSIEDTGDPTRPGIIHRLDKDTSGILVISKTKQAHANLSCQFQPQFKEDGSVTKQVECTYLALVWGTPAPLKGTIKTKIARHRVNRQKMCAVDIAKETKRGKIAVTNYETLKTWHSSFCKNNKHCSVKNTVSLVQFKLLTGRTHQIRVHCNYKKIPIIGDKLYGKTMENSKFWPKTLIHFPHQALHAKSISFFHPLTGEAVFFDCKLPECFEELLATLEKFGG